MRLLLARAAASVYIYAMLCVLPLMPLLASLVFANRKFMLNYRASLRKALVHIHAMRRGPALHYFHDVLGRVSQVPETILGECVQCGNCCMNHQCMFLERVGDKKYQCGIYHSPLRRFSNCGSFPLNRYDIDRYECPSYFAAGLGETKQVRWLALRPEPSVPSHSDTP